MGDYKSSKQIVPSRPDYHDCGDHDDHDDHEEVGSYMRKLEVVHREVGGCIQGSWGLSDLILHPTCLCKEVI